MRPVNFLSILFSLSCVWAVAQEGHKINVDIEGFEKDTLYLGYYMMDKQYLLDTTTVNADGTFTFESEEPLDPGMYLVVLPPNNDFFQLIINKDERHLEVSTDISSLNKSFKVEGSKDNALLYEYVNTLGSLRPRADSLNQEMDSLAQDDPKRQKIQQQLENLNTNVVNLQRNIIESYPNSMTAKIIKLNQNVDIPEFTGSKEEVQRQQYLFMREHYFDNIDLKDERLLRSPFLYQKIDFFVKKYHVQHPDTIIEAVDRVLEKMEEGSDMYKYYLSNFLNEYAASKIVGMDAVYVHLVENYYAKGKAPWTEEKQLKKIVDNATKLKPLLIGKTAPDFTAYTRNNKAISLHDVDSEYTILYFWRYDCGHCKKSTPVMKAFYENFKDKGVKIFAVCAKFTDEVPPCWEYIDDNEIANWIHVVDPFLRSKFTTIYDINSTPQVYVLDKDKTILSKKIGAEQLGEVMDNIIKFKEEEKKQAAGKR